MRGMTAIRGNTFPIKERIKEYGGQWDSVDKCWLVPDDVAEEVQALVPGDAPHRAGRISASVGDMRGVIALFDRARKKLKTPAIVLAVPGMPGETSPIRLTIASDKAKVPGSITVASQAKIVPAPADDQFPSREWYGRVLVNGTFQPSDAGARHSAAITARLIELSRDPARVAAEHGRLTGRCCWCHRALTDEKSTAVGYGRKCAENYGVAWGTAPGVLKSAAADQPMLLGFDGDDEKPF